MRVLVTGAASGIGRAPCLRVARDARAHGGAAKVAAVDLPAAGGLDELVKELGALGAEAIAIVADMADADAPARAVDEAASRFGALDGLVSNAGVNWPTATTSSSTAASAATSSAASPASRESPAAEATASATAAAR